MSKERNTDFTLNSLDDLFTSQNERDNGYLPNIQDIPLELLDDFPNHPFKVRDDEDMLKLIESVSERGVLVPAIVRPKADGRYELISGHRRKRASECAEKKTLRCMVSDLDDDAATIIMVDSNIQRTDILPSEKAFAYKMKLDAMKHQGQRTDLTSNPQGRKLVNKETAQIVGEENGDSQTQVRRYVRLTYLVPELLEMVDEGRIKMRPAVEISYLDEDSQRDLVDAIDTEDCTPSHAQTIKMRKFFDEGKLSPDVITSIMQEEKPNQKEKIVIPNKTVEKYIPKSIPAEKRQDYVCKALEHYGKYLQRSLFITVLSFILILTVYGRFFKIYMFTALAPIPFSTFAGEPTQNVGRSFIKSYCGVLLEGAVIILACIIFSLYASSPPQVDTDASAVTMVWKYVGELVFNMLVLVGTVKMSDRIVHEMMGM